jgi:hypothetical protein
MPGVLSNGQSLVPGEEGWSLYRQLLEVREEEDALAFRHTFLTTRLKLMIGRADGLKGIATWKTQCRERFDEAAFKLAHPDIFKFYLSASRSRFFRLA